MARTKINNDFPTQFTLFKKIKAKHDADGSSSVLNSYFDAQEIDLDADLIKGNAAEINHNNSLASKDDAEKQREQGNKRFKPVMKKVKRIVQNLKTFYAPAYPDVALWGVPTIESGRTKYESDIKKRIQYFKDIKIKHESYTPGTSPIDAFLLKNSIDLDALLVIVEAAEVFYENARLSKLNAVIEKQECRIKWKKVWKHVQGIYGYLKTMYADDPKMLTEYGFTIIETKKASAKRKCLLGGGKKITKNGLVFDSTFKNTKESILHLYKGFKVKGKPLILLPDQVFIIKKGYSRITVLNPEKNKRGGFDYESFC